MASTLTKLLVHITFSTKGRANLIPPESEEQLYAYIGGICRAKNCVLLAAGGTRDHVHLLINLSKKLALAALMLEIKRDTSKWLKEQDSALSSFAWQNGYFAFTIGQSALPRLRSYIATQKKHHQLMDFQSEVREFLQKYEIDINERYAWD